MNFGSISIKKGNISPTTIVYKKDGKTKLYNETGTMWNWSCDIESRVFKNLYADSLRWGHDGLFEPTTESLTFSLGSDDLPFHVLKFPIFVTNSQSFTSNFDCLHTKWKNDSKAKDIRKVKVGKDDPYFASLISAYVISQKGGISLEHLKENSKIPKIITGFTCITT